MTDHIKAVRYFYTAPLAAAWMHRYFDMRLQVLVADNPPVFYRWSPKQPDLAWQDNRYYLHPDSLHLLEPVDGDEYRNSAGEVETWASRLGLTWHPRYRIVFRDGKPFFWPESETI